MLSLGPALSDEDNDVHLTDLSRDAWSSTELKKRKQVTYNDVLYITVAITTTVFILPSSIQLR